MSALTISEVFGPTIQGEGPSAGKPASFIRLMDCNLNCHWCDTPYTWDWKGQNGTAYTRSDEAWKIELDDLLERIDKMGTDLVVVSGGEPLLRREVLQGLLARLTGSHRVEVETNGTFAPLPWMPHVSYNVSPKLSGSGVLENLRYVPDALEEFARRTDVAWKFVITGSQDVHEVLDMARTFSLDRTKVWLMAEGKTIEEQRAHFRFAADTAIKLGCNLSPRLHIEAWGDVRGV